MLRDLFSLFPACAGVILFLHGVHQSGLTFPRMCGGDPGDPLLSVDQPLFSPHVRG